MPKQRDQELFKGAAWYYARFRRGYPASFYKYLANLFKLNKGSRVLDLGTGTGQIAIPFSKIVKEVVAVDPNKEMLQEGKSLAKAKGISNIFWQQIYAEQISEKLGFFDLTTMGASFHWMEQDKVLEKVYKITKPGGGVVIFSNISSIQRNPGNDAWKKVVLKIIKKYLGEKRRAGKGYFNEKKDRYEDILDRSKFSVLAKYKDKYKQNWDINSIIGFLYSTSFAARWLFGDQIQ
ncbi:MAG: class I SAM-dependent methyltransferase, partial [Patescibacteria group bacterium]|nr:class I SAM-dependent methyltransferase [Patescibacteria group bacterium]